MLSRQAARAGVSDSWLGLQVVECRGRDRSRAQGVGDDTLGLGDDGIQVGLVAEALGVDLVDILGAGGTRGEPAGFGNDLEAADRRRRCAGARVSLAVIGSPARLAALTSDGSSLFNFAFCSGVAAVSIRV